MPRERRFTDEQQAQLCARVHCHHRREMHHYGSRGCLAEKCACLTFINPPQVDVELGDPQVTYTVPAMTEAEWAAMPPVFTLRAGKVTHYRALHFLAGALMEYQAPEEEIQAVVAAMNAFLVWHLNHGHDITKDAT